MPLDMLDLLVYQCSIFHIGHACEGHGGDGFFISCTACESGPKWCRYLSSLLYCERFVGLHQSSLFPTLILFEL